MQSEKSNEFSERFWSLTLLFEICEIFLLGADSFKRDSLKSV